MITVECDKAQLRGMPIEVKFTEHAGDLMMGTHDEHEYEIKRQLIEMMTEFIMENHLCEFTQMREITKDATTYRCRAFLLEKNCIKQLRETGQI